jgi:hypothetical protein
MRLKTGRRRVSKLSHRYLAFLWLAFNTDTGRFRNFLGYDRNGWKTLGRMTAMAAPCGRWESARPFADAGLRGAAGRLFEAAVPQRSRSPVRAPGRLHSGHASLSGLVPWRQSHSGRSQYTCESAARYL